MSEDLRFDGRVAVVTGAGGGLGRQHALLLASRGASVVVNDMKGAQDAVDEIEASGGRAVANTQSVATAEGGESVVQDAVDAFGRLDILVNNAGIVRDVPFEDTTPEVFDPVFDVHLRGAFYTTRPAYRHMRTHAYGRIVNTTSSSGLFGMFSQSAYAAAKMGIVGMTRVLANESVQDDIRVNALAPTAWTPMSSQYLPQDWEDKLRPALVSPLVVWLCHKDCPVTGEIYAAGGGYVAQAFIGLTRGVFDAELTPEDVRERFSEIRDRTDFSEPTSPADEFFEILERNGIDNPFKGDAGS